MNPSSSLTSLCAYDECQENVDVHVVIVCVYVNEYGVRLKGLSVNEHVHDVHHEHAEPLYVLNGQSYKGV
jgi:hypothetical protein